MKLKTLWLAVTSMNAVQAPALQYAGNIPDTQSINTTLSAALLNSQSSAGGYNFQASSATSATLTSLGNLLQQFTAGSATTVTLDSAYNIGLTLPRPLSVGQTFAFKMMTTASTTIATPTLTATDVTLAGTTSMLASALREYQGALSQVSTTVTAQLTSGTTFTSITQIGSTNNFTVALGTNAISPTVGTLLHVASVTGTLPAGWYPIIKVTSATSFVIATPPGTVWTATAVTLDGVAPTSAVYAPLMTITGLYTIGASAAV